MWQQQNVGGALSANISVRQIVWDCNRSKSATVGSVRVTGNPCPLFNPMNFLRIFNTWDNASNVCFLRLDEELDPCAEDEKLLSRARGLQSA